MARKMGIKFLISNSCIRVDDCASIGANTEEFHALFSFATKDYSADNEVNLTH